MKKPLKILITGASSGIGEAIAIHYAKLGHELLLVARRKAELERVQKLCGNAKLHLLVADVTASDFTERLSKSLADDLKGLDYCYANAGVGAAGRFEKLAIQDYRRAIEINVIGAIQTIQAAIPALEKTCGRIVITGSLNSFLALPLGGPYNISKFAVRALGLTLSAELAPQKIGVSIAYPGPVKTQILSLDNQGKFNPKAAEFFASHRALDPAVAASRMIQKAHSGKKEFSLSFATDLLLFCVRIFPSFSNLLIRLVYRKYEDKFVAMVGQVNPDSV